MTYNDPDSDEQSQHIWRIKYASMLRSTSVINTVTHIVYSFCSKMELDFILQITQEYKLLNNSYGSYPMLMVIMMYFLALSLFQSNISLVSLSHITNNFVSMLIQDIFLIYLLSRYSIMIVVYYVAFNAILHKYYIDQANIYEQVLQWQEAEITRNFQDEQTRSD